MSNYFSGINYRAEVTEMTKDGPKHSTIKIGPHETQKAAFAFAQSRLNWQGYKVRSVHAA